MRRIARLALVVLAWPLAMSAQAVQNATLRRAIQAYESLDFAQVITLANRALGERLTSPERARAYELLGFAFSANNLPDSAITTFKECILLDPDRELDPRRVSPRIDGYFSAALRQVMVVRQLRVDSAKFVGGQGFVPIRYHVTSSARVRTRAVSGGTSVLIDSSIAIGQINLRWPAQLPNGDPVPPGNYVIVVEATSGQNSFSASQPVRIAQGSVDTLPHLTSLPGYQELPATEIPPRSWRPMGLAFLYTGIAGAGAVGLENSNLGTGSRRELIAVGTAALVTGFVMTLRKPAPRPAQANILYNRLLREQIARRNAEIARENVARRQQVELVVVPLPKGGGAR